MSVSALDHVLLRRQAILDAKSELVGYSLALAEGSPPALPENTRVAALVCAAYAELGIRSALGQKLAYLHADPERITWRLQVTGGTETGEWELQPNGETTRVVHTMTHDGAFFALMRHAMHQVPNWRLDRLQQRAEQHH